MGPAREATSKLASRWQRSTSPSPSPLAVVRPAAAKPFLISWERCEKQQEVRAHFKDRHRSRVRRGKEKGAVPIASTRREKTGATDHLPSVIVAWWPERHMEKVEATSISSWCCHRTSNSMISCIECPVCGQHNYLFL